MTLSNNNIKNDTSIKLEKQRYIVLSRSKDGKHYTGKMTVIQEPKCK